MLFLIVYEIIHPAIGICDTIRNIIKDYINKNRVYGLIQPHKTILVDCKVKN